MNLIKKDAKWFSSAEAKAQFENLSGLEERTYFLYSYLVAAKCPNENDNSLFKMAFIFADAIYNSNLYYSSYEKLINPEENPFLAFVLRDKHIFLSNEYKAVLLLILNSKVDALNSDEWIYNSQYFHTPENYDFDTGDDDDISQRFKELGVFENEYTLIDTANFDVDDDLKTALFEIMVMY